MASAIPLVAALVGVGGSMYAQSESQRAQERANEEAREAAYAAEQRAVARQKELAAQNEAKWKENAFPTETELQSKRSELTSELGNERTNRLDQLSRTASLKGWGPGSGTLAKGASGIESSYLSSLGKGLTDLTQYSLTPRFSFPFQSSTLGQANTGYTGSNYSNTGSSGLGTALGYMMAKNGGSSWLYGKDDAYNPKYDLAFDQAQDSLWGLG